MRERQPPQIAANARAWKPVEVCNTAMNGPPLSATPSPSESVIDPADAVCHASAGRLRVYASRQHDRADRHTKDTQKP